MEDFKKMKVTEVSYEVFYFSAYIFLLQYSQSERRKSYFPGMSRIKNITEILISLIIHILLAVLVDYL
jgi:hypothetical protein